MALPTDIDTTYADDGVDARQLHQQHHDTLHALHNDWEGQTPALFGKLADNETVTGDWEHTGTLTGATVDVDTLRVKGPMFDVTHLDYGAVADGSTDDTAAIQAAIDACEAAGGGIVFFPQGVYALDGQLTVGSYVRLLGVSVAKRTSEITGGDPATGGGSVLKATSSLAADLLTNVDAAGNGNTTITIEGLRFDLTNLTLPSDHAAVVLDKVWRSQIVDCYVKGVATTNRRGIIVKNSSEQVEITDSRLEGCGVYVDRSNAVTVERCEIGAGTINVHLFAGSAGYQFRVINCHIYNSDTDNVKLEGGRGCLMAHNVIENAGNHGIHVSRNLKDTTFVGNVIKESSNDSAGIWSGLNIDASIASEPIERLIVLGNSFIDHQGTPTQKWGISIAESSSTVSECVITNNKFDGNTSGAVSDPTTANLVILAEGNDWTLQGDLEHTGANVGFFGTTPAAQPAAYTPTNVTADRAYDANATTLDEVADVLGTLIADLQTLGLVQ